MANFSAERTSLDEQLEKEKTDSTEHISRLQKQIEDERKNITEKNVLFIELEERLNIATTENETLSANIKNQIETNDVLIKQSEEKTKESVFE